MWYHIGQCQLLGAALDGLPRPWSLSFQGWIRKTILSRRGWCIALWTMATKGFASIMKKQHLIRNCPVASLPLRNVMVEQQIYFMLILPSFMIITWNCNISVWRWALHHEMYGFQIPHLTTMHFCKLITVCTRLEDLWNTSSLAFIQGSRFLWNMEGPDDHLFTYQNVASCMEPSSAQRLAFSTSLCGPEKPRMLCVVAHFHVYMLVLARLEFWMMPQKR